MKKKYPKWANVVSWVIIFSIPIGFVIEAIFRTNIGLFIVALGFVGLWVGGTVAERYRQRIIERDRSNENDISQVQ